MEPYNTKVMMYKKTKNKKQKLDYHLELGDDTISHLICGMTGRFAFFLNSLLRVLLTLLLQ